MGHPEFSFITSSGSASEHFVRYDVGGGRVAYHLTGVRLLGFNGSGTDFVRKDLQFEVPIPGLPSGQGLSLDHWAPVVVPAALASDAGARNPAWAVDTFALRETNRVRDKVLVTCRVAVRDPKVWLLRVSYAIHLLGRIAPLTPLGPTH